MLVRHFNYTGRRRLKREDVRIHLLEEDGRVSFAAHLNLQGYRLPADALVFVEAYRQYTLMRFAFGSVGRLRPPASCSLSEFTSSDGVRFRVIVTQDAEPRGRLLAAADRITPRREDEPEDTVPLLPVRADEDLEHEVFRVDFSDDPLLLINAAADDWREVTRHPAFAALAYPSILREILTRIVVVEGYGDLDDPDDWRSRWLLFARLVLHAGEVPGSSAPHFERLDWVDETVKAFCRQQTLMSHFGRYWRGEGQQ